MKKKVLASLLAVCMMVGLTVPAFATYETSSQTGNDDEITALAFSKDSITVENGEEESLLDVLTAYCGDKKINQNPENLYWTIEDNLAIGLDQTTGTVSAAENSGSAIVTVKNEENGKIVAKIKVVATKKVEKVEATGYKFTKSDWNVTSTGSIDIKIDPSNSNGSFSAAQEAAMITALTGTTTATMGQTTVPVTVTFVKNDDGTLIFNVDGGAALTTADSAKKNFALKVAKFNLPHPTGNGKDLPIAEKSTRLVVKKPVQATKIVRTSSIKIEVGQTADLRDCYAVTTGATWGTDVDYTMEPWNDTFSDYDYAVQDDADRFMIRGIAVGKQLAIITLENGEIARIPVEVVARGTLTTPDEEEVTVSPANGSIKVGDKLTLTGPSDDLTWTISDATKATLSATTGKTVDVVGLAAGTVVVTAKTADGVVVGTSKITITDGTTTPEVPGGTPNPGTGDTLFSNLF